MLKINLQLYSILREKLPSEAKGRTVLQYDEGATIVDILDELGIDRRVVISINGEHESNKSRLLKDGDSVKLFSSVGGG